MIPTPILQSLISIQRNKLAVLNETRAFYKYWRKLYDETGDEANENACHELYKEHTKAAAKAEKIQKALKREMAQALAVQRITAQYADVIGNAKAMADECY